jgi:O-antigen/teichoic acid export membrane protein
MKDFFQQFNKTIIDYLKKGGVWLFLVQFSTFIFSFLLTIAFANLVSKEVYGQYKYLLAVAGYLVLFTLMGMGNAIAQAVSRGYDASIFTALKKRMKWSTLGSAAGIFIAVYYFLNGNAIFGFSFLIISLFNPFSRTFDIFRGYLKGKLDFKRFSAYSGAVELFNTIAVILLLFVTSNIILIIFVYFFSYFVSNLLFFILSIKKLSPNKREDPKTISYGKHLSLLDLIKGLSDNFDLILLWFLAGPITVAVYSIASAIPRKITGLTGAPILSLALPKMSQKSVKTLKKEIPKKALFLFLCFLPLILLYIFFAPLIFKIFFPDYMDAVFYSQIFVFVLLFVPESLFYYSLISKMQVKSMYINNFIFPFVRFFLIILFTYLFGVLGTIMAVLVSYSAKLILSMTLFYKMHEN